jgi:hypothetical protein
MNLIIRGLILITLIFAVYDFFGETGLEEINTSFIILFYIIELSALLLADIYGSDLTQICVAIVSFICLTFLAVTAFKNVNEIVGDSSECTNLNNDTAKNECFEEWRSRRGE